MKKIVSGSIQPQHRDAVTCYPQGGGVTLRNTGCEVGTNFILTPVAL